MLFIESEEGVKLGQPRHEFITIRADEKRFVAALDIRRQQPASQISVGDSARVAERRQPLVAD